MLCRKRGGSRISVFDVFDLEDFEVKCTHSRTHTNTPVGCPCFMGTFNRHNDFN